MFGYDYSAPAAYLRDYLEVLAPALAGEPVDHHGARVTGVGQLTLPKAPAPWIITAALGPRMLDLAGKLTDGTATAWAGPKAVEQQIVPRITKAAESAARPAPEIIVGLLVSVAGDADAVRRQIESAFSLAADMPAYRAMVDLEGVSRVTNGASLGRNPSGRRALWLGPADRTHRLSDRLTILCVGLHNSAAPRRGLGISSRCGAVTGPIISQRMAWSRSAPGGTNLRSRRWVMVIAEA